MTLFNFEVCLPLENSKEKKYIAIEALTVGISIHGYSTKKKHVVIPEVK